MAVCRKAGVSFALASFPCPYEFKLCGLQAFPEISCVARNCRREQDVGLRETFIRDADDCYSRVCRNLCEQFRDDIHVLLELSFLVRPDDSNRL